MPAARWTSPTRPGGLHGTAEERSSATCGDGTLSGRVLLVVESSDGELANAVGGLAAQLAGTGTVFVPVPAVPRNARAATPVPAAVVVALDDATAGRAVGEWLTAYLGRYPAATLICTVGDRSRRLGAGQPGPVPDALRELLGT